MSMTAAILLGVFIGIIFSFIWFYFGRLQHMHAQHQYELAELQREHEVEIALARKRSVNTSRAVLKGKMAEQFAPFMPEFGYLPSDAKFLGDPIDYVVFSGYSEYREGLCEIEDIEVIFIDIKSGQARLTKGQQAIEQAILDGRVRFETLKIDFPD